MGGVFPPPTRVFECGDWGARVGCACGVVVELLSSGSAHHLTLPDGAVATFQGCNRPFCARGCEQVPDTWLTRRALPQSGCRASPVRPQRRALPQFERPRVACAPPVSRVAAVGVPRVRWEPPASCVAAVCATARRLCAACVVRCHSWGVARLLCAPSVARHRNGPRHATLQRWTADGASRRRWKYADVCSRRIVDNGTVRTHGSERWRPASRTI